MLYKSAFINFFLLITVFAAVSCKKKINTKADLINYINDKKNGLLKSQEIGGIKVELRYKPWQLMVINRTDHHQPEIGELKSKYFFVLSLSANNKELLRQLPYNQYSEMVQVLAFRMVNYIAIVPDEEKPVEPQECIFQQTYGTASANQLLLAFDNIKLQNAHKLNIMIKEFGLNIGNLNFQINKKDIDNILTVSIR
jgi:hypothetical protein